MTMPDIKIPPQLEDRWESLVKGFPQHMMPNEVRLAMMTVFKKFFMGGVSALHLHYMETENEAQMKTKFDEITIFLIEDALDGLEKRTKSDQKAERGF